MTLFATTCSRVTCSCCRTVTRSCCSCCAVTVFHTTVKCSCAVTSTTIVELMRTIDSPTMLCNTLQYRAHSTATQCDAQQCTGFKEQ
eukprot:7973-Heterococcus_DN1.PRE.8